MSAATTPSSASMYDPYLGQFEEPKMRGDRQVAVSTLAEEPAALIGHGGVCEGGRFWRRQPPTFLYSERTFRAAGAHSNLQRLGLLASRREPQSTKVGRMSSWSEEGRVRPAYVSGDVTLGEVTPQPGKGTLGHGGGGEMNRAVWA